MPNTSKLRFNFKAIWAAAVPVAVLLFKFLAFDAVWCFYTTFKAFSTWQLYLTAATGALLLALPSVLWRRTWPQAAVMALTDCWLVANLMYYRTYFAAIPPSSYFLAGNLADFMPSVVDSLRAVDILLPVSTVAFILYRRRHRARLPWRPWATVTGCAVATLAAAIIAGGGFKKMYGSLQLSAHLYASGTPMYTPAGHIVYGLLTATPDISPDELAEVEDWLRSRPALAPADSTAAAPTTLVVILAESLESWVIGANVEGHEITPRLNSLVADSTTLYAPRILTQVKGGRSIDAQLLLLAGLIPVESGTYSVQYPDHTYPTLPKALKEKRGARSYLLTVDKAKTWNQGAIARSFGIDTILSYPDFELTETAGSRKRLADGAFFDQIQGKMRRGEIWPADSAAYVQIVTYSGHAPFRLPEHLRRIHFSEAVPALLADYMTTANYTDHAIGSFIDYLRTRPDYDRMLIVITGDHEGLAQNRPGLVADAARLGISDDFAGQYTPFVVLNARRGGHIDGVAGQVDMYPTVLELMQLQDYGWHGLGRSLLDPGRAAIAVGSTMRVDGDTIGASAEADRLRRAHTVSDRIIRYDLLAR